jgi:hypothetical protein
MAAACAAVVVPVLLPGGTPTSFGRKAWAVQRNADGTDMVRITQFAFDGAGLQQALERPARRELPRWRVRSG